VRLPWGVDFIYKDLICFQLLGQGDGFPLACIEIIELGVRMNAEFAPGATKEYSRAKLELEMEFPGLSILRKRLAE
jgi:hypothetical protein